MTGPAQSISHEVYGIVSQLKMCGGKSSILPGVVSLYSAYLCRSESVFHGSYVFLWVY